MRENYLKICFIVIISLSIVTACGSQGPSGGAGGGNTVVVAAGTDSTKGTLATVASATDSTTFVTNFYTITSTPYTGFTGTPSPVSLLSVTLSYTPVSGFNGIAPPPIPPLPLFSKPPTLQPSGSVTEEVLIIDNFSKSTVFAPYTTALRTTTASQFVYDVSITFKGQEINTGTDVSATTGTTLFVTH